MPKNSQSKTALQPETVSELEKEINMNENTAAMTVLPVGEAAPFKVLGQEILFTRKSQYTCVLGDPESRIMTHVGENSAVRLGSVMGMMNALLHLDKGQIYPIAEYGFHCKFDWDEIPYVQTPKKANGKYVPCAYINFTRLERSKNTETLNKLADLGAVRDPKRKDFAGWTAFKIIAGGFVPFFHVEPKTWKNLLDGREASEVTEYEKQDNEYKWAIVHKHVGIDNALLLLSGKHAVTLHITPRVGFESLFKMFEAKLSEFAMSDKEYAERRADVIARVQSRAKLNAHADYIARNDEVRAVEIEKTANGIMVLVDGELETRTVQQLLKCSLKLVKGEVPYGVPEYMRNENTVLAFLRKADMRGESVAVVEQG